MNIPALAFVVATLLPPSAASVAAPTGILAPATPFNPEHAAPATAITFDANQRKEGSVEVPSVTLRSDGDWSVFLITKSMPGNNMTGTVLFIGTPSDTLFCDAGHLSITW